MSPEEKFWQLFMIPGDLDHAQPGQYRNGLFGFQVSASAKGDAVGQLLNYDRTENATAVSPQDQRHPKILRRTNQARYPHHCF